MKLEGKVAIISGGAGAMGATEAKMFASEGARVVIGDVVSGESVAGRSRTWEVRPCSAPWT